MIRFRDIEKNEKIKILLKQADMIFASLGYKKHGLRHAKLSADIAGNIYKFLDLDPDEAELAKIAAYMHDIGNALSTQYHEMSGSVLTEKILRQEHVKFEYARKIIEAVGNHEVREVSPPSAITAAVILADKTDIHRSRVRKYKQKDLDTHTRVNLACNKSFLRVNKEKKIIKLEIEINENICRPMEYFEIFLSRLKALRRASNFLGCQFHLYINGNRYT